MEKRLVDVVAPLVANGEPAELGEPRKCTLHHPPITTQLLTTLDSFPGYPNLYTALAESLTTLLEIISFVGVQLIGALPRSASTRTLDGLYGVYQFLKDCRFVFVCCSDHHRERDSTPVANNMALRARFSLIRRIRSGFVAPFLAGMEAESNEALSQSIFSASPRRSRRTRCMRSHTPASCHSCKRRQQVMPEPQPISLGSISQGMPLLRTKMMPVRAARSSMRGLPPFGLGGSLGNNGSTISQSSSVT